MDDVDFQNNRTRTSTIWKTIVILSLESQCQVWDPNLVKNIDARRVSVFNKILDSIVGHDYWKILESSGCSIFIEGKILHHVCLESHLTH